MLNVLEQGKANYHESIIMLVYTDQITTPYPTTMYYGQVPDRKKSRKETVAHWLT